MYKTKTLGIAALSIAGAFILSGCGTVRETLPDRSAMEQLLISTAADRAAAELPGSPFPDQAVYFDPSNLESYDKPYVIQRLKTALRNAGARLVTKKDKADVILEMASGGLSIDKQDYLFGIPELPLPVSVGGEPLAFPEVPIYKRVTYKAKAKFLFSLVDSDTGGGVLDIPLCYGKAHSNYWWLFFFGPLESTDLPSERDKTNFIIRYKK